MSYFNLVVLIILVAFFTFYIAIASATTVAKFGVKIDWIRINNEPEYKKQYQAHGRYWVFAGFLTWTSAFIYWSSIVSPPILDFVEQRSPWVLCSLLALWLALVVFFVIGGAYIFTLPFQLVSSIRAVDDAAAPFGAALATHAIQLFLLLPTLAQLVLALGACIPTILFEGSTSYYAGSPLYGQKTGLPDFFEHDVPMGASLLGLEKDDWGLLWIFHWTVWPNVIYSVVEVAVFWSWPFTHHMRWIQLLPIHFWAGVMLYRTYKLLQKKREPQRKCV